jgi:hypothetical protein
VQAVAAFNPALALVSFVKRNPSSASKSLHQFLAEKPELWAKASPLAHGNN